MRKVGGSAGLFGKRDATHDDILPKEEGHNEITMIELLSAQFSRLRTSITFEQETVHGRIHKAPPKPVTRLTSLESVFHVFACHFHQET